VSRAVRVANCSGFYGDRLSAAREMVEGGPIDVLTGDYLAELTMLILWKARQRDPSTGYAATFLTQLEQVLGPCLDRGIPVVTNAGGLNPAGMAERIRQLAAAAGLSPRVAYVEGDDLMPTLADLAAAGQPLRHLDDGRALAEAGVTPLTANAYLGAWGIVEALAAGADVVVCPRVTDASLVVGPAAWWHGWHREDVDRLAGAVVAGHIVECGPQATGGNYAWIEEVRDRRYPGFPIAEIAADGSSVITKHPGTGGLVSVGTVTAQLLYELAGPRYANPDVVARFDTIALEQVGHDRVRVSGVRGEPPPATTKVGVNYEGGYRNTMTLVLTGLDIDTKAAWAEAELFEILGGRDRFDEVHVELVRFDREDAPTNALATAHLRITVMSGDRDLVGRSFSNATMELALGGYAGFHTTTPPGDATMYGVFWPTSMPNELVRQRVVLPDGSHKDIAPPRVVQDLVEPTSAGEVLGTSKRGSDERPAGEAGDEWRAGEVGDERHAGNARDADGAVVVAPLGRICGARSGDKGGNANVGVWARDDETFSWLRRELTTDRFRLLVPEAGPLPVHRYELDNLRALNFVVVGLLGRGVAASVRLDPQAKGLGEYLRSRHLPIPVRLLRAAGAAPARRQPNE
jgi:hypothetical protein